MIPIKRLLALVAALVFAAFSFAAGNNAKFLLPNLFDHVLISPDGAHVSMVENGFGGETLIKIVETDTFEVDRTHVSNGKGGKAQVAGLAWLGSDTLVITSNLDTGNGLYVFRLGDRLPDRWAKEGTRSLEAVIPGTKRFIVKETSKDGEPELSRLIEYDADGGPESAKVVYEVASKSLQAFFDSSGALRLVKKSASDSSGEAWFRVAADGEETKLSGLSPWTKVFGIHGTSDQAIAAGYFGGAESSLVAYNFVADRSEQTLTEHSLYSLDVFGDAEFDAETGKFVGFSLDGMEPTSFWLDPHYQELQKKIDGLLVGSKNRIVSLGAKGKNVLVERIFPMLPSLVCLVNPETESVRVMVQGGGKIGPEEVGSTKLVSVPNRDGVMVPIVLTTPVGYKGGSAPLLVWFRKEVWGGLDRLEWSPEANYFAALGYVVVRVNYRGSKGLLGDLKADLKSKEDISKAFLDVEDVVDALVKAGLADPQKVAVGGEGAGGWAASYAAKVSPERYRAVLCFNGLYDLEAVLDEKTGYDASGGVSLEFASRWSGTPREDIVYFQTVEGIDAYPKYVFVCSGKWSPGEYKSQVSRFVKTIKKAGATVKLIDGDWYGTGLNEGKRIDAFEKASAVLKSAFK